MTSATLGQVFILPSTLFGVTYIVSCFLTPAEYSGVDPGIIVLSRRVTLHWQQPMTRPLLDSWTLGCAYRENAVVSAYDHLLNVSEG